MINRPGRGPLLVAILAIGVTTTACGAATGSPAATTDAGGVPSVAPSYPGWPASGAILGNPNLVPFLISSEAVVGRNRLLVTVADRTQALIAAPDLPVELRFFDLATEPDTPVTDLPGTFQWLVQDTKGLYVVNADFSHAGEWGLEVVANVSTASELRSRLVFSVTETSRTPALGAAAPPSDTLVASDLEGIFRISTDTTPDPSFYALSIRQALAAGKPFVVVFASPLLCVSQTCGPALDVVKGIAPAYRDRLNFVHVEPYELQPAPGLHVGRTPLQPVLDATGRPKTVKAVTEWGLPSEPYVFVIGSDGTVKAKFEGVAYHDELVAALDDLFR